MITAIRLSASAVFLRLQRRQRRQELALGVDEAEHVGDITVRQLLVERLLADLLVIALGLSPDQLLRVLIVVQVRQLALFQLVVECQPLRAQFDRQCVELGIDWLAQEGNVHLRERVGLVVHRDQLVGEVAVLQAVVQIDFARLESLPDLPI